MELNSKVLFVIGCEFILEELKNNFLFTNKLLVPVTWDSIFLNNVSTLSFVDKKNMIDKRDTPPRVVS